ncbi:MAG: nucleotidyl transferase AbiEii/AbiGii toxin family protein [Bacilli bacterium]|nr:nucleotidyl transferase AbiEii/AbiGii toxin family protein [Bacilli bacterium]
MDIDTAVRKANFTEENIVKMVTEIIDIDVKDNVEFKIEKTSAIRDEDEYGGLRVTINFSLENIKDKLYIDIATGDPIHPGPDDFNYESLLGNEVYKVWSYNLETVLAEKIETILSKLETSSRMKDYYDIYLIHKFKFNKINKINLRGAVEKTFERRKFNADIITSLNIIKDSNVLRKKWISYAKKNSYAKDLDFDETIKCLEDFIKVITPTFT